jgi:hypothetical protein
MLFNKNLTGSNEKKNFQKFYDKAWDRYEGVERHAGMKKKAEVWTSDSEFPSYLLNKYGKQKKPTAGTYFT